MDLIEVQKTNTNWKAKIWFKGKSSFGFIPLPYTLKVSFNDIKRELQIINPKHSIIFI